MSGTGRLEMTPRPRLMLAGGIVLVLAAVLLAWTRSDDPEALPTTQQMVPASTKVDSPIFVGMFTAGEDFDRKLHLSGVKVRATSNTPDITLTPLLCRGGSLTVTTDPDVFCPELVNPEGQTFGRGDEIVLQVEGTVPAVAVVERVRLAFRENLQWGTLPAGGEAVVRILPE